jgi:hypothetical protein
VVKSENVRLITRLFLFIFFLAMFRSRIDSIEVLFITFFIIFFPALYFPKYQPFWLYIQSEANTDLSKSANINQARSEGLSMLLTLSYSLFYSVLIFLVTSIAIDKLLVAFSYSTRMMVTLLMYVISTILFYRIMRYLAIKLNRIKKLGADS